jgi:hypothetical protein
MRSSGAAPRTLATGFDTTAVILAGSIPMPTLISLLAPLVVGSPVLAKVASHDRVTAYHVARSVAEVDPLLGRCMGLVEFPGTDRDSVDALLRAGCVVATGSDDTIAAVRARAAATTRLVSYGHRLSLAAVDARELDRDSAIAASRGFALDIALWDQLGCLSPIAVFVVDPDGAAAHFSSLLAEALEEASARLPRGRVEPAAAAAIAQERSGAEMRAASGAEVEIRSGSDNAWTVVTEASAAQRPIPLHRFIRVVPVSDRSEFLTAVAPFEAHLAAVAVAGFGPETDSLARDLVRLGASRICAPGSMQAPPIAWRHDNQGVFAPLSRFGDFEVIV